MKRTIRAVALVAAALTSGAAMAVQPNGFVAAATPSQEVPNNPSIPDPALVPSCIASFRIAGADTLVYRIRCANITSVTSAHIHGPATADETGGVRVTLFSGPTTGDVVGVLAAGTITRSGLGSAAFDLLLADMKADLTYLNVHTSANPAGEVRGQISPVRLPDGPQLVF
tara:strand:- start:605 stop:1114 length:510 start_codon:yes stop_codon:yes gene_type:complete